MRALVVAIATLCVLASGATAAAGGWAVTTLDTVPDDMQPGLTYSIGYTIKQHNQTPVRLEDTAIVITNVDSGKTVRFAGRPEGPTGHHVARVTFPEAGRWAWEAHQD